MEPPTKALATPPAGPPSTTELAALHSELYDALAGEYDARVETLRPIVTETLEALLLPRLAPGSFCLDVGCGAGLVSELLVAAGHRVLAMDISEEMVKVTARRVPGAAVACGDYLRTSFAQPFDAISAFAFVHLFPAEQGSRLLRRIHDDLRPGGIVLTGTTASSAEGEGFEPKADYPGAPARYRRRFTEDSFLAALREAGLELVEVIRHGDPFGKVWVDVIARRPA